MIWTHDCLKVVTNIHNQVRNQTNGPTALMYEINDNSNVTVGIIDSHNSSWMKIELSMNENLLV